MINNHHLTKKLLRKALRKKNRPTIQAGYCFVLTTRTYGWRTANCEMWSLELYNPKMGEIFIGYRYIDNQKMACYRCSDGFIRAQNTMFVAQNSPRK